MSVGYDEYLREHINNVNRGLHWMRDNLDLDQKLRDKLDLATLDFSHDSSKFGADEYGPYDQYFYEKKNNRSYQVCRDFDYAWLHHIHNNPHHWQYWVLFEDDPEEEGVQPFKVLEMPEEYVFEMIADWWTFSWKSENLYEIFDWYKEHRDKQFMHMKTRKLVEDILEKIKSVLDMQKRLNGEEETGDNAETTVETIEHADISEEDEDLYGVPELKKFPLSDQKHVRSAIRFFNYVDPKYEKELAEAILEKAEEFGLDLKRDISIGDENRFQKYLEKKN